MFSMLLSKYFFKVPPNGLYFLRFMIHDACTFIEHETGAIADHCFEAPIFSNILTAIVQTYFQSSSEWLTGFTTYDRRYLDLLLNVGLKL